jgi:hypothetical protein
MKIALSLGLIAACWTSNVSIAAVLSPDQCSALAASIHHQPSPDIIYRADPNLVPADLTPQPDVIQSGDQIKMDLKSTNGLPGSAALPAREMTYGQVTIKILEDGKARMLLNGRDVDDDTRSQLLAACGKK